MHERQGEHWREPLTPVDPVGGIRSHVKLHGLSALDYHVNPSGPGAGCLPPSYDPKNAIRRIQISDSCEPLNR